MGRYMDGSPDLKKASAVMATINRLFGHGTPKQPKWFISAIIGLNVDGNWAVNVKITDYNEMPFLDSLSLKEPMNGIDIILISQKTGKKIYTAPVIDITEPSCPLPSHYQDSYHTKYNNNDILEKVDIPIELNEQDIIEMINE